MPGTVTQTRTSNIDIVKGPPRQILVTLACTSDAAAGTIPDTTIAGLANYVLKEIITTPASGGTIPEAQYRIYVTDSASGKLFLGSARSVSAKEHESGVAGGDTGYYPEIDGTITLRVAGTGDLNQANIGNSNVITIVLRFERNY